MFAQPIKQPDNRSSKNLRIGGLTPLTTIDYPEHLSCVIYTQGCAWRCRYCHNPELVYASREASHSWQQVLDFLKTRRGLLEAVVFCGGEPLLQNGLFDAMQDVQDLGFKIGLHSAGGLPNKFKKVLNLVDWVGFDVKDLPEYVDKTTQIIGSGEDNWHSLQLLLHSGVDYQCRTTLHWSLLSPARLVQLTKKLVRIGVKNYAIQFSRTQNMLDAQLGHSVLPSAELEMLKQQLIKILPSIQFSH